MSDRMTDATPAAPPLCECGHAEAAHGRQTGYCWCRIGAEDAAASYCQCAGFRPALPSAPSPASEPTILAFAKQCDCKGDGTGGHVDTCATITALRASLRLAPAPASEPTPDLAALLDEYADACAEVEFVIADEQKGDGAVQDAILVRRESRATLDRSLAALSARVERAESALDGEVAERERREEQIEQIYYELGGVGEWSSACDLGDEALRLAESAAHDSSLIDGLEAVMRPKDGYVEVYLAGLRPGHADATGYQVEFQPLVIPVEQASTLREAIRAALAASRSTTGESR